MPITSPPPPPPPLSPPPRNHDGSSVRQDSHSDAWIIETLNALSTKPTAVAVRWSSRRPVVHEVEEGGRVRGGRKEEVWKRRIEEDWMERDEDVEGWGEGEKEEQDFMRALLELKGRGRLGRRNMSE